MSPRSSAAYFADYYRTHKARRDQQSHDRQMALPPVVYVWASPDGTAEYVGRGTSARWRAHRKRAPWWTPDHFVLVMVCESEWQAMEYEGKWGAAYRPRHNREGYRR